MEKINNRGKVKFAVAMIIITGCFAVASKVLIIDPQYIDRVKTNKIYIGGFEKNILMKTIRDFISNSKRMVLFVAMQDDSRGNEDDYYEDGTSGSPSIEVYFGIYEVKKGNYILTTTDSAGINFSIQMLLKRKRLVIIAEEYSKVISVFQRAKVELQKKVLF